MAERMALTDAMIAAAAKAAEGIDADVYLFNGTVQRGRDLQCVEAAFTHRGRPRALLLPVTNGGDPDAAYKIARYLQDKYEGVTALISGMCKSAGTLMALGAGELAFTPFGELGPLDIQLTKVDKFDQLQSGLTIQDALDTLENRAFKSFYSIVQDYMEANSGLISFATASKASADFVAQLYAPVFSRIDPEEIGTRSRSMRIATEYGKRLDAKAQNLKPNTLKLLAETYPSHSFAIDQREATGLFHRVRSATKAEQALVAALGKFARFEVPRGSDFVFRALSTKQNPREAADNATDQRRGSSQKNGRNPARANGKTDPAPVATRRRTKPVPPKRPNGGAVAG
jgi:hypothetical protein